MDGYSVSVEARALAGQRMDDAETAVDDLMDAVANHHGVCGANATNWNARVSVDADDAAMASAVGSQLVRSLAVKAGLPDWPIVHVDAIRDDVLDEENARPNYPDLVSGAEAARILGISRQRLHTLAGQHPSFPRPMYELGVGKIWLRAAIEAFDERWERRPGWPKGVSRRSA